MIPERINALDELATVNTAYGPMEKWKARALSIGWMQRKIDEARVAGAPTAPMHAKSEHALFVRACSTHRRLIGAASASKSRGV